MGYFALGYATRTPENDVEPLSLAMSDVADPPAQTTCTWAVSLASMSAKTLTFCVK